MKTIDIMLYRCKYLAATDYNENLFVLEIQYKMCSILLCSFALYAIQTIWISSKRLP